MRSRMSLQITVGLIAMALSGAAPARAATNLACMDSGYTAEQQKLLDAAAVQMTAKDGKPNSATDQSMMIIMTHAGTCAHLSNWSPEAVKLALFYKLFSQMVAALDAKIGLSPDQHAQLLNTFASADKTSLRQSLAPVMQQFLRDGSLPDDETPEQDRLVGSIITASGLHLNRAQTKPVGGWIGMRVILDGMADDFQKY